MATIVKCPKEFEPPITVFVAGGISNTADWQKKFTDLLYLTLSDRVHLINPRRESFDISDPTQSEYQIDWEHRHLMHSDHAIFWFSHETLCPITLFELGKWLASRKDVHIGVHPDYARRLDVIHQTAHFNPEIKIHSTIEDLARSLVNKLIEQYGESITPFRTYGIMRRYYETPPANVPDVWKVTVQYQHNRQWPDTSALSHSLVRLVDVLVDLTTGKVIKQRFAEEDAPPISLFDNSPLMDERFLSQQRELL